jgi:DNA (cytosine-5)-methyltransferase 1
MCSGYEGLGMAIASMLDVELTWVGDPDPGAAAILAHHWPHVPNVGDITAVDWAAVPRVDVLAAGFPCQSVSTAGKRAGLVPDAASGLWAHVAAAIAVLRPPLVVIENVGGLRSARAGGDVEPCPWCLGDPGEQHHLRALGAVLGDLATLGFDAEWVSLNASDVGAPHQRDRVFIVAWPAAHPPNLRHQRCRAARGRRHGSADGGLAAADAQGDGWDEGRPEPAGIVRGSDAALGGGATAPDADRDGRARGPQRHRDQEAGLEAQQRDDADGRVLDWGKYAPAIDRWARILGRPAPAPTEPGLNGQPRLTPAFVEWLMGLPDGHVTAVPGLSRNQQLTALGNGVVPQQGAAALAVLLDRIEEAAA